MDTKTAFNFVNKLLEQTKAHKIKWKHTLHEHTLADHSDSAYWYVANTRQGEIVLGKSSYDSKDFRLYITPLSNAVYGPTYEFSEFVNWYDRENTQKYKACLKELFELVYESLPNPDSFVNSFLDE